MRIPVSVLILLVASCWGVSAAEPDYLAPKLLTGSIYDKPAGRLLFTFRRSATQTGDVVSVLREFHNPDGSLAALERVRYERGRLIRFELDERQVGASGHAVVEFLSTQRQIHFQYTARSGQTVRRKQKRETLREQPLISDMLPAFLVDHWDALSRGEAVKLRYIVVPRLETVAFKLQRESAGELHGKKVVRIKMEPSSRLIAQFLDPLLFTVEADPPHRVLQYWGRTTPKLRFRQSWNDLDALTVFIWE
ncbi:MAG: hypothetical protein L0Y58_12110 [Verrucomicrobia subdivision 3 bacterium]|nr:hypothetical protein [Limisphaerales bacterium]